MSLNQASSLPLPIPTGRATPGVGAPDGASAPAASQAGGSAFDDLMVATVKMAATAEAKPVSDSDQDTKDTPTVATLDAVQQPLVPAVPLQVPPQEQPQLSAPRLQAQGQLVIQTGIAPQAGAPFASPLGLVAQAPDATADAKSSPSSAPAANTAVPAADAAASQPGAATATAPAPAPALQKTDGLTSGLKAARKALAPEIDTRTVPRSQAPSGFTLQSQVETPGSYSATGAQTAGTTQGGSNLARATVETLSNMAVQINRKLSDGNTKFAVELHPADLGKVEVTLTIARDGTTTAHLKFDTPVTAAAFQAREGELRHQLAQTGLNFDSGSLSFSSRDGGDTGGGFNQSFAQTQQDQQSRNRAFQDATAVADAADSSAAVDAGLLALRAGGTSSTLALDLIV